MCTTTASAENSFGPSSNNFVGNSIFHLNINSLRNKIDEFNIIINDVKPEVVCLTEHHLVEDEIFLYKLDGYSLVSYYCRNTCKDGGVAIYVKNCIKARKLHLKNVNCIDKNFEFCCAQINYSGINHAVNIIAFYRTPDANAIQFLEEMPVLLDELVNTSKSLVVCGDFNFHFDTNEKYVTEVIDIFAAFGLKGYVREPTRVGKTSASLIDNFFTDISAESIKCEVIKTCVSDHFSQILFINNVLQTFPKITYIYINVFLMKLT